MNHDVLAREIAQAALFFRQTGRSIDGDKLKTLHEASCQLWRRHRSSYTEHLWLKVSIVYLTAVADQKLDWPTMANTIPLNPIEDSPTHVFAYSASNWSLYHRFLGNMAIVGTMSRHPTWQSVAEYLSAEVSGRMQPVFERWYGATILVLAYWLSLSSDGSREKADTIFKSARYVLDSFCNDPRMELCVLARSLTGDGDGMIVEKPGLLGFGRKLRPAFFSQDDLYVP